MVYSWLCKEANRINVIAIPTSFEYLRYPDGRQRIHMVLIDYQYKLLGQPFILSIDYRNDFKAWKNLQPYYIKMNFMNLGKLIIFWFQLLQLSMQKHTVVFRSKFHFCVKKNKFSVWEINSIKFSFRMFHNRDTNQQSILNPFLRPLWNSLVGHLCPFSHFFHWSPL